mmetsp:Transcript_3445/g.10169  ORF Transcript_3445/g.10169 Transcript_3445/m.10169 type:complete len:319 (-) Transcript_3445:8-964(-)
MEVHGCLKLRGRLERAGPGPGTGTVPASGRQPLLGQGGGLGLAGRGRRHAVGPEVGAGGEGEEELDVAAHAAVAGPQRQAPCQQRLALHPLRRRLARPQQPRQCRLGLCRLRPWRRGALGVEGGRGDQSQHEAHVLLRQRVAALHRHHQPRELGELVENADVLAEHHRQPPQQLPRLVRQQVRGGRHRRPREAPAHRLLEAGLDERQGVGQAGRGRRLAPHAPLLLHRALVAAKEKRHGSGRPRGGRSLRGRCLGSSSLLCQRRRPQAQVPLEARGEVAHEGAGLAAEGGLAVLVPDQAEEAHGLEAFQDALVRKLHE